MERPAVDELHRDVINVVALAVIEHGHGVRMRELRGDRRFEEEALVELGIAIAFVLGAQYFQRADTPERRLFGAVNLAHPSASNHADDLEPIVDGFTDERIWLIRAALRVLDQIRLNVAHVGCLAHRVLTSNEHRPPPWCARRSKKSLPIERAGVN